MSRQLAGEPPLPRAQPIHFGPSDRPLFGWVHRPAPGTPPRTTGLVICNPFGYEALCAHRSLRHFAEAASALGYFTLRFDYDGTGDSAGDDLDPDRWTAWQASVGHAVEEIRRRSGATQACLLGVRLGATLATLVAASRDDVTGLAAIAPVVSGRPWLRETRALQAAMGRAEPPAELALPAGVTESVGLPLGEETRTAIGAVDLLTTPRPPAARCLVLDRDDRPASDTWCAHLRGLGAQVDHQVLPGYVEMTLDPHEARVPERMRSAFSAWLAAEFPEQGAGALTGDAPATGPVAMAPGLEEQPVFLDPERRLFGIVTAARASRPTRALLLLNSGANHHVGNGRMYVKFARRLAEAGWLVLRYDVSGIGDSLPRPGGRENDVYTGNAAADLAAAVSFVRDRPGVSHVELAGLCSGAYHGFKGAVAGLPVDGVNVINPLTFFWKPGMSLAYPPFQMVQAAAQYRRSALQPEKWVKALRGQVKVGVVLNVVARRLLDRARGLARNLGRVLRLPLTDDLGAEVRQVVDRGTALRFTFSVGDPGESLLRDGAGWALPALERDDRVTISYLEDCDHSLSASWMHELLFRNLQAGWNGR